MCDLFFLLSFSLHSRSIYLNHSYVRIIYKHISICLISEIYHIYTHIYCIIMCEHLFVTNMWTPKSTHRLLKQIWLYDDWNLYMGVYIAWGLSIWVYCIWDGRDLTAYVWRCNVIESSRALHHFLLGRVGTEWGGMTHRWERVDGKPRSRGDRTRWRDRVNMVAEKAWTGVGNLIAWKSWTHVYR